MRKNTARTIFEIKLTPAQCRLHHKVIARLSKSFVTQTNVKEDKHDYLTASVQFNAVQFLMQWIRDEIKQLNKIYRGYDEFVERYAHAVTIEEQQRLVLSFAKKLGADAQQLRGDKRAFFRWFGHEAVTERFQRRSAENGRDIAFVLRRIGVLSAELFLEGGRDQAADLWRRLAMEKFIEPLLMYTKFEPIRIAAFHCLVDPLHVLPQQVRQAGVSDETLRYVYRCALNQRQDIWLQCEALKLLDELSRENFLTVAVTRLESPGEDADLFVRRQIVRLLGSKIDESNESVQLIKAINSDPSAAVRQSLLPALNDAPLSLIEVCLYKLACDDSVAQVRAAAIYAFINLVKRPDCFELIENCLEKILLQEKDEFVLRVALHGVATGFVVLTEQARNEVSIWRDRLIPLVTELHRTAESTPVRRYAAKIRETVWLRGDAQAWQLVEQLQAFIKSVPEGRARALPKNLAARVHDEQFGRVLSWIAQEDFGFDVSLGRRPKIIRGHKFGFRSWRFLHEFRNPSSDKRQAFRHTTGRIFPGKIRAPSAILAELAQTKVPGEPLYISTDNDWRPYLPLIDELISGLDLSLAEKSLEIYTSEGVTQVILPDSFRKRLVARTKLTNRFVYFAELRNWHEQGGQAATHYLAEIQKLGFNFNFRAYGDSASSPIVDMNTSVDDRVTRFFPAIFPFAEGDWLTRIKDYFFSVYENTLSELILFLLLAGTWFFARQVYLYSIIQKTRRAMPLVIGGWGTRGKSGTERLKAALFNALGYNVISKTSGCEAMFLHGYAHGNLREMFLFRPYDKATIWEQANVLKLATQLNGEVFLWECMGLTPSYIEILQQQWMRDDICTITNTYPDHEDLQGPAGINIPQVMTEFIPKDSVLVTSEEQMLPILRESANNKNTKVRTIGWMEAGMLAPDLLSRFPYEEHPYNIALVMEMANELDIDADFAICEMANRVVADLGVLKVSPPAPIRGRQLEFTNGMSANERFGCMANWQRIGYMTQDPYSEPGVWLTTVVNNRADRVSRSKVFATMLVNDLMTDRNVLIGNNLDGLQSYIRDEWAEYSVSLTLWPAQADDAKNVTPIEVLSKATKRFRLLVTREAIEIELSRMLENIGVVDVDQSVSLLVDNPEKMLQQFEDKITDVERLVEHVQDRLKILAEFDVLARSLKEVSDSQDEELDEKFRAQMKQWFERRFIVVEDYYATGEDVIREIVKTTPPGIFNRVMGVQNIKGTGLDFVYRWQAWGLCHAACSELRSDDALVAQRGLQTLVAYKDFGTVSEEYVNETLESVRHASHAQTERFQAELNVIQSNLEMALRKVSGSQGSQKSLGWMTEVINVIEALLDSGDAVTRRKQANLIYREMTSERISSAQAALELHALNKRQKGGWLLARIEKALNRVTDGLRKP